MGNSSKPYRCVGMLVNNYYPGDVRVRREAEELATENIDVHVVCTRISDLNEPKAETINGVHVYRLPLTHKRGGKIRYFCEFTTLIFLGFLKLFILHMKKNFDVVHIHNMPDILVVAGLIPKFLGATLILDVHDPMNELFQSNYHVNEDYFIVRAIKFQEWLSYKLADNIITVSHTMAENVAKKSGRPVNDIKIVHNFPNLKIFPIQEGELQWPHNKNSFVILYSGTVTEHYGLDTAVRAVAIATKDIQNIRLQILGDGNRISKVLHLASELGISDRVEHVKPVKNELVKDIMAEADVGISPHNGGIFADLYFSNKIIEYMTQGLPVISSHTYTFKKYVPEDCIFYFEPDNVESLVKQIILMYNNPNLVQNKIKNSKRLVTKYNWQIEKGSFISFYKELLKSNGKEI